MKRLAPWLTVLSACSANGPEIVVVVDGEPAVVAVSRSARVSVLTEDAVVDKYETGLSGVAPSCLPFSLGVAPGVDADEDADLSIIVELDRIDGSIARRRIDTRFAPGTRELAIVFEAACASGDCDRVDPIADLPEVDKDDLIARLSGRACQPLVDPLECVGAGGCFLDHDPLRPVCVTPCPQSSAVAPPLPPEPPTAPAPPSFAPCPNGWMEQPRAGGPTTCVPWPVGAADCPVGEVRFPGASCRRLGAVCPATELPEPFPAGAIAVRANVDDLQAIVASAPDDARIILGRGTHVTGSVVIDHPLTIEGTCASESIVQVSGSTTTFAVRAIARISALTIRGGSTGVFVSAGDLILESARIESPSYEGIRVEGARLEAGEVSIRDAGGTGLRAESSTISVRGLEIDGATSSGIRIARTRADLQEIAVRDIAAGPSAPIGTGSAILVRHRSQVTLAHALIEGSVDFDLYVREQSEVTASNVVSRGRGLRITNASKVRIDRSMFEGVVGTAVYVNDSGALNASDFWAQDIGDINGTFGTGVECSSHARVNITRLWIERPARRGADLVDCPSALEDVTIIDPGAGSFGVGLELGNGRHRLQRARIVGPRDEGISIRDLGRLDASDLTLVDGGRSDGDAISIGPTSQLTLARASVSGFSDGISVDHTTSTVTIELADLEIRDVEQVALKVAAFSSAGAELHVARALIADCGYNGVYLGNGLPMAQDVTQLTADLEDLRITGCGKRQPMFTGVSLQLAERSVVEGRRIAIEDADDAAVVIDNDPGGRAHLQDLSALRSTCRPNNSSCGLHAGTGIAVIRDAIGEVERFVLADQARYGVRQQVGEISLSDGEIARNPVGILSSIAGSQLQQLLVKVHFTANGENISTDSP